MIPTNNDLKNRCVEIAKSYLGVRYRHQGRSRDGLDCVGFLKTVSDELGMDIQYPHNYSPTPTSTSITDMVGSYFSEKSIEEIKPGDILTFYFDNKCHHVGIYLGDSKFIHAISRKGSNKGCVRIDDMSQHRFYQKSLHRAYDLYTYRK